MRPLTQGVKTQEYMNRIIRILTDKKSFYFLFLLMNFIGVIWLLYTGKSPALEYMSLKKLLLLKTAALIIYLLFVYLSLRNIKFITWLMVCILLFSGLGTASLGIFRVEWTQYFLKPYFTVFGIYFIFGAVTLIYYGVKRKEKF